MVGASVTDAVAVDTPLALVAVRTNVVAAETGVMVEVPVTVPMLDIDRLLAPVTLQLSATDRVAPAGMTFGFAVKLKMVGGFVSRSGGLAKSGVVDRSIPSDKSIGDKSGGLDVVELQPAVTTTNTEATASARDAASMSGGRIAEQM
jgi:hypothetical protein